DRLRGEWPWMIHMLPAMGSVLATTSNEHASLATRGSYEYVKTLGSLGRAFGGIDIRFSLAEWRSAFLLREEIGREVRSSVQIFDTCGSATHQIASTTSDHGRVFDSLLSEQLMNERSALELEPPPWPCVELADESVDVASLRQRWLEMRDEVDFELLLAEFGLTLLQALRLAGRDLAFPVPPDTFEKV